jgi:hypothetical protein
MLAPTIQVNRNDLDKNIEVLSSAADALRLTRFERISYRALILSVDAATLAGAVLFLLGMLFQFLSPSGQERLDSFGIVLGVVVLCLVLMGVLSLMLNIPLFVRVFRERARLKKLGLSALSKSLWMESRRSQWISRIRRISLVSIGTFIGLLLIIGLLDTIITNRPVSNDIALGFVTLLTILGLLFASRYLQNQRERIDLTANAEELTKTFQSLQQRAGTAGSVTIPVEILEKTANIESAQIASERKDAVLKSIASNSQEYAIAFDRGAVEQRATLGIADRIELENLVDRLSANPEEPDSQTVTPNRQIIPVDRTRGRTLRAATKSNRVKVDYIIDHASRRIRITGVAAGSSRPSSLERS